MIEMIFLSLWITIFTLLCMGIKRALRQRARECRHDQVRALRRFTRGNPYSRHSRHAEAYQQRAAA